MKTPSATAAIALFLFVLSAPLPAFAACDPSEDETCCASDADCAVWVSPSQCTILPVNKTTADKRAKENLPVSGKCVESSVEKLRVTAKTYVPVCVSRMCEFKLPEEA